MNLPLVFGLALAGAILIEKGVGLFGAGLSDGAGSALANADTSPAGQAAAAGGIANPFGGSPAPHVTRTDQGIDFTLPAGSPIAAIGDGIIRGIIPGWYSGQPLVFYELTGGPFKGRFVYVAEQIDRILPVGTHVKAGQPVAYFAATGTAGEMGWATSTGQTLAAARGDVSMVPDPRAGGGLHHSAEGQHFHDLLAGLGFIT